MCRSCSDIQDCRLLTYDLNGMILRGLFEHERLKPATIRMSQGNIQKFGSIKASYDMQA